MSLRLPDKWVWDFWLVQDRKASTTSSTYRRRERSGRRPFVTTMPPSATRSHKTSAHGELLPDALHPGPDGSWDDLATWTGSTLEHDGRWYMLYTGINRREGGLIQRIGLATSEDLVNWVQAPREPGARGRPALVRPAGATRGGAISPGAIPWLFRQPDHGSFHCLVTARSPLGATDAAGVVGHARSLNLVDWEVTSAAHRTRATSRRSRYRSSFSLDGCVRRCSSHARRSTTRRERIARLGPGRDRNVRLRLPRCSARTPRRAPRSPPRTARSARSTRESSSSGRPEAWEFMAFRGNGDRDFLGDLIDPLPVTVEARGPGSSS